MLPAPPRDSYEAHPVSRSMQTKKAGDVLSSFGRAQSISDLPRVPQTP
jgi:hypothetical protein